MDILPAVLYRTDHEDRLAEVNDGWVAFAAANGGQALQPAHILGRPLWDFLADVTTRQLYHAMVQRLRQGGPPSDSGSANERVATWELRTRLGELEERVDFAERLLAQQRELQGLAPPKR